MKKYCAGKKNLTSIAKRGLLIVMTLSFVGCSSGNRKDTLALRSFIKQRDFKKAENFVKKKSFIKDKHSRLLKYLEQGTVFYLNNNFYQSLKIFEKAKTLSDKLYTTSISKKISSAVANDNYDNYYGEKYERSMIRFYLSLNHFLLFQKGEYESFTIDIRKKGKKGDTKETKVIPLKKLTDKQKRFHLMGAKSILLEWNSLLDNYKSTTAGVVTYKDDLLAKIYGAFIHEQFHTRSDSQIALSLYKEAKNVLLKNFNILKTYNNKADKFKNDYKKLYKLPLKKVEQDYISQTLYAKNLVKYLDEKISQLKKRKNDNVFILLEDNLITEKTTSKIDIPLPMGSTTVAAGGKLSFTSFAASVLSSSDESALKIYFEIPKISFKPIKSEYLIVIKDKKGNVVKSEKSAIVNPLGDLAQVTLDEKKKSIYLKTGARVATKHVAALVAAYVIYKSQAKSSELFALAAASLSYLAANKGIEMSEKADTRYWATLPLDFQVSSHRLPKGEYILYLRNNSGQEQKISEFVVKSLNDSVLLKERIMNITTKKGTK